MSLVDRQTTPARVAASQANGRKSKGPKTPAGKARVSLNALKTGAYAKTDKARREIMVRRGENPDDFEQLHQELREEWQPEYVTEAMLVKTLAEKNFDKAQLRAAWMESQLNCLRIAEIQAQRRQLLARRWLPGCPAVEPGAQGLWLAKDSPSKFKKMFDRLERLEKWVEEETCPDEYPQTMRELYGECPSLAGEKVRLLVLDYFGEDEAARHKACKKLPQWLAQERSDVERERELYQREMAIGGNAGPNLSEEEVARKEAALERQIREHTRLLLQLKTTRSQWGPPSEGLGASGIAAPIDVPPTLRLASSGGSAPCPSSSPSAGTPSGGPTGGASFGHNAESVSEDPSTDHRTVDGGAVAAENEKTAQSNLVSQV
jgi:hypothetical protein